MVDKLCAEVISIYTNESNQKIQTEKLCRLLDQVLSTNNVPNVGSDCSQLIKILQKLVETVVNNESTSMVVSRQFIADIADRLKLIAVHNNNLVIGLANVVLNQLQARAIAYEEQSNQIRIILADCYEKTGNFEQAARALVAIPLETGQRGYRPDFKMELYLRITELFLEAGNILEADRHVKRASLLQQDVKEDGGVLLLKYSALYARVFDRQGQFIEAASRYYEISIKQGLLPSEKKQILQNALICTLLAPPGLQRNRLLNTLFKDERCQGLACYQLLKNMYLERLIQNSELKEFELLLLPHQRLLDSEGSSILQRSVLEHNFLAASRLYSNISFDGLGQLLGVSTKKAEKIASQMISTDKVHGKINQLDSTVSFESKDSFNDRSDSQIISICELTNSINEQLAARFPEWHAEVVKSYQDGNNKEENELVY
uniref:COP9 signalosome complex subunit 4 n=1 Tax=Meloidogyne hapla TaxID=6305 RepID=A0A1I8BYM7_MELHA